MGNDREAFEVWFSDNGASPKAIERSGDGYRLMQAQSAWVAWQAAYREGFGDGYEKRHAEVLAALA